MKYEYVTSEKKVRTLFDRIYGKELNIDNELMIITFYQGADVWIEMFCRDVARNHYTDIHESPFYPAIAFICEMFEHETDEFCRPADILIQYGIMNKTE